MSCMSTLTARAARAGIVISSGRCSTPPLAGNLIACFFGRSNRFSREGTLETLQHLQRLTSYGVAFKSFTEQYLDGTGLFRDAIIGILAALAKQERVRLSERVHAGLERAAAQGHIGGRPTVNRKADPDASVIRRLRDEGQSYSEVAAELGRQQVDILPRVHDAWLLPGGMN